MEIRGDFVQGGFCPGFREKKGVMKSLNFKNYTDTVDTT